ncbi:MAG: tetratricopeptide repeat protein [Phycisphaeraceae bacterium]
MGLLGQIARLLTGGTSKPARAKRRSAKHGAVPSKGWSDHDIRIVAESAQSMVRVVNESMQIAKSTGSFATKQSRLRVVRENLRQLKAMRQQYPFLILKELEAVEAEWVQLQNEVQRRDYAAMADGNQKGQALEKEGRPDEAIGVYERLLAQGVDTPFTYRRLAILYRKRKDGENEMRVLDAACQNIPPTNPKHHQWFVERREKLRTKMKA